MPPKQSLKRRQDDERSPGPASGRKTKKVGKSKREATYETYDEAMDGGVEMEEKGERYRDGDKAQRFYEKALDLYKKAYDFSPTFDAAYNQARVLFTLSTSFHLPPTSVSYLTTSIDLYRHAVTLTTEAALSLDAGYNLAQALLELAEVLEDLHSDKDEEVRNLRLEAVYILGQVMDGQAGYLRDRTPEEDVKVDESGDAEVPPAPDEDQGMEVDQNGDSDTAEASSSYETYLPTPSTFIDTCLLSLDTHLALWTTLEPPSIPSAEDQTVVRAILDRAAAMGIKGKQAELDFGEIKVLLALDEIVWRMHKGEVQSSTDVQPSLAKAIVAIGSLLTSLDLNPPDEPTLRADILTTLAEVESTIALRLMYLCSSSPAGAVQEDPRAWQHVGATITHLNKALELPTSASTPRTFKPSVLLSLSQASLARARTARITSIARPHVPQLIENALNYAVKAGESIGWGWINPSRLDLAAKQVHPNRVELPWPAGWDAELLARSIALQVLRTAYYAMEDETLELSPEIKERYKVLAKGILDRFKGLDGERKVQGRDIMRLLDDVEEREGVLALEEKQWWERIADELG